MAVTKVSVWSTHVADIARALKVVEKFTNDLNENQPEHSELEFMAPTRVEIQMYGDPTNFALVQEDGAWYLEVGDTND